MSASFNTKAAQNDGYRDIFPVQGAFTRYMYGRPLRQKGACGVWFRWVLCAFGSEVFG